jgi:D-beta-D-heptose 7-phosphate kinase/D-beta-D-heptose 1-phosphate adenosyltransferase
MTLEAIHPDAISVDALATGRVAVLGDVMLDRYVSGEVARISPEAPVPVLAVSHERETPGGAANVAANISALGGAVSLIGLTGEDEAADRLERLLSGRAGVGLSLVRAAGRPTILKTRYVAGQQQIVRVDRESTAPISPTEEDALLAALARALPQAAVLVLSDYGKGALSDRVIRGAIEQAQASGKLVVVDPKRRDFSIYRGADIVTPNRKELAEATGLPARDDEDAERAAAAVFTQCGAAVLLTRSERGMSLFRPGTSPLHMPAQALEVFDVSGAGDTVAAVFGLGLASGLSIEAAMLAANTAAGVVVGKRGTATVSPAELRAALARLTGRMDQRRDALADARLLTLDEAVQRREDWARAGLRVGFANGCFDLLHPGHVSLLRQAAAACDRLIVAINSDASVSRLKGPSRPLQSAEARADVLAALKGVDAVIQFEEDTPLRVITALQPDLLVKGADYREDQVVGADLVKARGGRVLLVELVDGQSTTSIAQRAGGGAPR